jgi:hypothetical protein
MRSTVFAVSWSCLSVNCLGTLLSRIEQTAEYADRAGDARAALRTLTCRLVMRFTE